MNAKTFIAALAARLGASLFWFLLFSLIIWLGALILALSYHYGLIGYFRFFAPLCAVANLALACHVAEDYVKARGHVALAGLLWLVSFSLGLFALYEMADMTIF